MKNNLSCSMEENPLRGFAFVQFSNSFNNTLYHFGGDAEIVCMSVHFPALRQKKALTILWRALQDCRDIADQGIDLRFRVFQLPGDGVKYSNGIFRVIFLIPGNTVCTGVRLYDDLKNKLERCANGHPFDITLDRPAHDEYEGAFVFSSDNFQLAHSWLAECLLDAEDCGCRPRRRKYLPRLQETLCNLVG